ncbi:hypothetical protein GCM10009828_042810 [Actinoplanes couchii]
MTSRCRGIPASRPKTAATEGRSTSRAAQDRNAAEEDGAEGAVEGGVEGVAEGGVEGVAEGGVEGAV